MLPMRKRSAVFAAILGALLLSVSRSARAENAVVSEVAKQYWDLTLADDIALREEMGLPIEALPDVSDAHAKDLAAKAKTMLEKLQTVSPESLPLEEKISLLVLRRELTTWSESPKYSAFFLPITPYSSPFSAIRRILGAYKFSNVEDETRYLKLLDETARLAGAVEIKLHGSVARGIVLPRDEIDLLVPSLDSLSHSSGDSPFQVAESRLKAKGLKASKFRKDVAAKIDLKISPAFARLITYLVSDYRREAPEKVGLSQYPGGLDCYKFLIRYHTGSTLSPEEIHRIGLSEMERINRELDEVRQKVGFSGTLAEFRQFLKTDARFFPKTPEEIGQRLMAAVHKLEPKIPSYFSRMPKAPYGVKRLDPALEGAMTFGYYQIPTPQSPEGDYMYNASRLPERSLLNASALIAHELIPGHHFQLNLQKENDALPEWRRHLTDVTAYVEGWGEYSSAIAGELGLYDDPYDRAGRLAMEAFICNRLVVDTGMNALGWTRERAMKYMRENTFETDLQISTETLRYSCDIPAQALAYKMGARKFFELRERAKQALGEKFDIRKFHEAVLGSGALPMDVLEEKIDAWIAAEKANGT
jgi:uncharacterized protein (DUF885 family)